jgi:hypothetical protein
MPILGIIASSISGNLDAGDFESIATVTVGSGGAASIEFTSIPGTYAHLQVRGILRSAVASGGDFAALTFNNVGGSSYATHYLYGTGTSGQAFAFSSSAYIYLDFVAGAAQTASVFSGYVLDILDYANTNKNKTVRWLGGNDLNGSGNISFQSGLFNSTNAITSLKLQTNSGANFSQYSHFALYGIRSA